MIGALWDGVARLLAPGLRLMLRRRVARGKEDPARLAERFGVAADEAARPAGKLMWLHAASVGEMLSVLPLIAAMPEDWQVLLTSGTVTSAQLAAQRIGQMGLAGRVRHRFVPLDVPGWVARFLDHWRPDLAIFVESELWPNMLAACRRRGIALALVNGRMSAKSFATWRRVQGFARAVLGGFDLIAAQSGEDAARFAELSGRGVEAWGNLKEAAAPLPVDAAELARLRAVLAGRPVWLAAQTHPGEEAQIAACHARLVAEWPNLLTIVVPRHPERGAELAALPGPLLGAPRRHLGEGPPDGAGIWIADTLGELGLFYRLGELCFLGNSLVPKAVGKGGGHNPLEPARLGVAIATGPLTGNFNEAMAQLRAADAVAEVADAAALAAWVAGLLRDGEARARARARVLAVFADAEGLPGRIVGRLLEITS